jgi:hypothetical protein
VVGGNSQNSDWPDHSSVGLKQAFPRLDVVVCTTDDGGSTGKLLRQLPMIGIGDLRKSCLSLILPERLGRTYGIEHDAIHGVLRLIQQVFNYRVPDADHGFRLLKDPLLAAGPGLRRACPKPLASALRSLGTHLSPSGRGPTIRPAGHCLGNLLPGESSADRGSLPGSGGGNAPRAGPGGDQGRAGRHRTPPRGSPQPAARGDGNPRTAQVPLRQRCRSLRPEQGGEGTTGVSRGAAHG